MCFSRNLGLKTNKIVVEIEAVLFHKHQSHSDLWSFRDNFAIFHFPVSSNTLFFLMFCDL